MPAATAIKNARTLVAVGTSVPAATPVRSTPLDMRTRLGGLLTARIANGATGPTAQCELRILAAHDNGASPAAASAGAVWKTLQVFGGTTTANAVTDFTFQVPDDVMHLLIEFAGNTGQAVTAEALLSETTAIDIT